jgi:hypothetical protein
MTPVMMILAFILTPPAGQNTAPARHVLHQKADVAATLRKKGRL